MGKRSRKSRLEFDRLADALQKKSRSLKLEVKRKKKQREYQTTNIKLNKDKSKEKRMSVRNTIYFILIIGE